MVQRVQVLLEQGLAGPHQVPDAEAVLESDQHLRELPVQLRLLEYDPVQGWRLEELDHLRHQAAHEGGPGLLNREHTDVVRDERQALRGACFDQSGRLAVDVDRDYLKEALYCVLVLDLRRPLRGEVGRALLVPGLPQENRDVVEREALVEDRQRLE